MVGPCEAIASESRIHILRVGSVLIMQTEVSGLAGVHVDDLLGGRDEVFVKTMLKVEREFDFV